MLPPFALRAAVAFGSCGELGVAELLDESCGDVVPGGVVVRCSVGVARVGRPGFWSSVSVAELEDEGLGWAGAFASASAGFACEVVLPPGPLLSFVSVAGSSALENSVDAELACCPVSEVVGAAPP